MNNSLMPSYSGSGKHGAFLLKIEGVLWSDGGVNRRLCQSGRCSVHSAFQRNELGYAMELQTKKRIVKNCDIKFENVFWLDPMVWSSQCLSQEVFENGKFVIGGGY